jgi:hypothetical protein
MPKIFNTRNQSREATVNASTCEGYYIGLAALAGPKGLASEDSELLAQSLEREAWRARLAAGRDESGARKKARYTA